MVLIGKAPVRIDFGSDGIDLSAYYKHYDGLVISSTISYHVYAILTADMPREIETTSADHYSFDCLPPNGDLVWDNSHHLPEAISHHFNIQNGVTILTASQIPPGIDLGYTSSMSVALIKALALWCGLDLEPEAVAELAYSFGAKSTDTLICKHDPYAVAFGGFNALTVSRSGVTVEPLELPNGTLKALEEKMMLFFADPTRQSLAALQQGQPTQQEASQTFHTLEAIKVLSLEIREALEKGGLDRFGRLLHHLWVEKRQLTAKTTNPIDRYYQIAREHGALGGKGASTKKGGFLLLYCPEKHQAAVTKSLKDLGLKPQPLKLNNQGVRVISWPQSQELPRTLFEQTETQTKIAQ